MKLIFIIISFFVTILANAKGTTSFKMEVSKISPKLEKTLQKYSWRPACPSSLANLRFLKIRYWGIDKRPHYGELIVNKELVEDLRQIFSILYAHKFPIEKMKLIDKFAANDEASMSANNTTAFNCRALTGQPGLYSQHSYGRAIDINPRFNPYVDGEKILPVNGKKFRDRNKPYPGKINQQSLIYKLFIQHGWDWGGSWYDVQDYQHFEKRANGKKRNPYGYGK